MLLWCLATLNRRPPERWTGRLIDAASAKMRVFDAHQLGMSMWALAALRMSPGEDFLEAVVQRAIALLMAP